MLAIRDILRAVDAEYSFARAAKWDKVGLLIGDENANVEKVLVAHEVTDAVLDAAADCDVLVAYHPPIFRALENLNFRDHAVRLAARCIAQKLNVIAVHTALDHAPPPNALGDKLAQALGLNNVEVLQPDGCEALFKVVVFVPQEALEKVSEAMWNAGASRIGNYDRASFRARGIGTFRPLAGANPYEGEIGKDEVVDEWRLEVLVAESQRAAVVAAMRAAHPYEEVAHDVYPLHNEGASYGSCRMGSLAQSTPLADYAALLSESLRAPSTRVVAATEMIQKIACVPGSGASFIAAAARAGCDCLVTGDIKHHDALQAKALGLSLIDVTHAATERAAVPMLVEALSTLGVEVTRCEVETNPFENGQ